MVARWLAAGLATLVLAGACTSSSPTSDTSSDTFSEVAPPATTEQAPPNDPAMMERVVRAWSEALNAGEDKTAARLFELPALVAQGTTVIEFRTYQDLTIFHEELPCSGTIVSISYDEPDVALAVFALGDRPTSACDAEPGTLAAARFVFREGQLYGWQQVPVPEDGATTTGEPVV